jgi:hypothetical protein
MGPTAGRCGKHKVSFPCREPNPNSSAIQRVAHSYTDLNIPAPETAIFSQISAKQSTRCHYSRVETQPTCSRMFLPKYETTRCHNPEGNNFNYHPDENLKY